MSNAAEKPAYSALAPPSPSPPQASDAPGVITPERASSASLTPESTGPRRDASATQPGYSPEPAAATPSGLAAGRPHASIADSSSRGGSAARVNVDDLFQTVDQRTDAAASRPGWLPSHNGDGIDPETDELDDQAPPYPTEDPVPTTAATAQLKPEDESQHLMNTPQKVLTVIERSDGQNLSGIGLQTSTRSATTPEEGSDARRTGRAEESDVDKDEHSPVPAPAPAPVSSSSTNATGRPPVHATTATGAVTPRGYSTNDYVSGMNRSGRTTPQQRALVPQYGTGADPSPYSGTRGRSVSSEAGSQSGGAGRYAEVRAMLIKAERDLAELREECARRGMTIQRLEAALDREEQNADAMRERHADEADEQKAEHESQTKQLREQLRVMKLVSEGAMADKAKLIEEAERRKRELLSLLDRERQEKSSIMADYREQTEALISEQGREITSLRGALEKVKAEFEQMAQDHDALRDDRDDLAAKLEEAQRQCEKDRADHGRKLNDVQTQLQTQKEDLQDQLNAQQEAQMREANRHNARQQELSDQLQRATEKAQALEEQHHQTADNMRQQHAKEKASLQQELEAAKSKAAKAEDSHRKELDKAIKTEQRTTDTLRQALEQARADKESAVAEAHRQKDDMQGQQRTKVAQMQETINALSREVAEEKAARKDAEADVEVLQLRAGNQEKTIATLTEELEAAAVDHRDRERGAQQAHDAASEELRDKLRDMASELTYAQQQLRQQAVELQRARDEEADTAAELDRVKKEHKRDAQKAKDALAKHAQTTSEETKQLEDALGAARSQKNQLESDNHRLERALKDAESRLQNTTRQAGDERQALEETAKKLQDTRVQLADVQQALRLEQERGEALDNTLRTVQHQLEEAHQQIEELSNELDNADRKLHEQQADQARQTKANDGKALEQEQRHKAEVAALRMAIDQARAETSRAKDALLSKDGTVQSLREENGQLQRESALREGALQEEMDDMQASHEEELRRMDDILNGLRADLAKSQNMCTQYQRELSNANRDMEGEKSDLELALEQSEAARAKLQEDAKYREQLNQELQGTVRLLTARLNANEDDSRRMKDEVEETGRKLQDVHTLLGRKDAAIAQLNAKLRAYEARGGTL